MDKEPELEPTLLGASKFITVSLVAIMLAALVVMLLPGEDNSVNYQVIPLEAPTPQIEADALTVSDGIVENLDGGFIVWVEGGCRSMTKVKLVHTEQGTHGIVNDKMYPLEHLEDEVEDCI